MKRMITKKMRDSFNVMNTKFEFAFGLVDKSHVENLLSKPKIKQRILILRRVVK